jgi:hypothetical protein
MIHPNYETLIKYVEDQLPVFDLARTEEHLSYPCHECNNKVVQLRIVLEAVKKDKTATPPSEILNRAVAAFKNRPATTHRPLLRVLAELLFDSRLQLSPMGSRGAARTRQMLFTTQQVDIDLSIAPEHRDHNLVGQVLDREQVDAPLGAFVSLQNETGTLLRSIETDPLGQFTFKQIPPGVYDLVIDLGNQEVAITGLEFSND